MLFLDIYPLKLTNICAYKGLYPNIYISVIDNSPKVETNQMSINTKLHKQIRVYTYKGILFSHKKEWSSDTCVHVDETCKHHAKWKKPDTKGHMLCDSIYIKCPKEANP